MCPEYHYLSFWFLQKKNPSSPRAVPGWVLYSLWHVTGAAVFSNTSVSSIFVQAVRKKIKSRLCTACNTGTKTVITLWTGESDSVSLPVGSVITLKLAVFQMSLDSLQEQTDCWRPWRVFTGLKETFRVRYLFRIDGRYDVICLKASSEFRKLLYPRVKMGYIWNGFQFGAKKCLFNQCVCMCLCCWRGPITACQIKEPHCVLFAPFPVSCSYI